MSRWIEGKVIEQKIWTPTLFSLYVQADIEPFQAGQFTQIGVNINEKMLFRPYSFVNAPEDNKLEFFYNIVPQGELTPHLVSLKPRDPVWLVRKAAGRFTLEHVSAGKNLWMLSTGTGSSPFLSILRSANVWERFSKVIWAHSVRHKDELTHPSVVQSLLNKYQERFCFIPIVTRENQPGMLHQRLPVLLKENILQDHCSMPLSATESQVMLCGNPAMIQDVILLLEQKGFVLSHPKKPGNITIENYWKLSD